MPRLLYLITTALALASMAGCTSTAPVPAGGGQGQAIAVNSTDTACQVGATDAPAGTITFAVHNGGTAITEFYLYGPGARIMGEVENVGPGLTRQLIAEVPDGGTYTTSCRPGMVGDGIRAPFRITGTAARSVDQNTKLAEAAAGYKHYVISQVAALVPRTQDFADAVKRRDVAGAKALFPVSRRYWERIEPVAESFGDIDPRTDGRDDGDPGVPFTGYHRLERDLWTTGLRPDSPAIADMLAADMKDLQRRVATIQLTPVQMVSGAKSLLDEIATRKLTGEEDRYSHTDLFDVRGNLEGSRAAVAAFRPVIEESDPALGKTLDRQFDSVDALLERYRTPTGYRPYTELTAADKKALASAVDALAEPVSRVAGAVSG